jgi:hypothetical protein
MARPAPPDDTSPARLIATMVGIVGILLLGSLAWSAVGALFAALGAAASSLAPRPSPTRFPTAIVAAVVTPSATARAAATETPLPAPALMPTQQPTAVVSTPAPEAIATSTPAARGRAPWILLPSPAPGSRVAPGAVTIEARGRGDAPITAIRLEMDGAALPVSFEQRGEATWRSVALTRVAAGQHAVHATVIDDQGRSGGYRWTFEAGP